MSNHLLVSCAAATSLVHLLRDAKRVALAWYDIERQYPGIPRSALRKRFELVSNRRLGDYIFFEGDD